MKMVFFLKSDRTRQITTTRWEIIQTSLLRDIRTSRELEQAILTYNHKYVKDWKFKALHALFEKVSIKRHFCKHSKIANIVISLW